MKKDIKIGVVGLGFVGLTLSIASALKGIKVYGLEVNEVTKNNIKEGKAHFYEPGINNYLENVLNKNFFIVDDLDKIEELDAIIITVGTPLLSDNSTPNFEYIKEALNSIGKNIAKNTVVILRSTVAVGTTRQTVIPYLKEILNVEDDELFVHSRKFYNRYKDGFLPFHIMIYDNQRIELYNIYILFYVTL